jgi:hypothetical protein
LPAALEAEDRVKIKQSVSTVTTVDSTQGLEIEMAAGFKDLDLVFRLISNNQ